MTDLDDYYYLVGRNRAAGLQDAEEKADEALQHEWKGTTMTNQEAMIREAWEEMKRMGLIEKTGDVREGQPVYNFSPKGNQIMDNILAQRPGLSGEELEDALVAEIEHIRGTLS